MPPPSESHQAVARRAKAGARVVLRGIGLNALLAAVKLAGGCSGIPTR